MNRLVPAGENVTTAGAGSANVANESQVAQVRLPRGTGRAAT
jgi:hypothetical protein